MKFTDYQYNSLEIEQSIERARKEVILSQAKPAVIRTLISSIDLTSLEGSDNDNSITTLCHKALTSYDQSKEIPPVAAVCVYPSFVRLVKKQLAGTTIKTASVAGAFPSGQTSLHIKLDEVSYAAGEGADEIDVVINRGKLIQGEFNEVYDELAAIREGSAGLRLKVILETGELMIPELIRKASEIAIISGADFIKTSTGKIPVGATPEAFLVMLQAIRDYQASTRKAIGIKASGGIRSTEQAMMYHFLTLDILGVKWSEDCNFFRIGASSLLDSLLKEIKN